MPEMCSFKVISYCIVYYDHYSWYINMKVALEQLYIHI